MDVQTFLTAGHPSLRLCTRRTDTELKIRKGGQYVSERESKIRNCSNWLDK